MRMRSILAGTLLINSVAFISSPASAQNYPTKPIRIVRGATGGGIDFTARLVGQALSAALGQPAIVDNRGGGGGIIAGELIAKAQPDAYTLLVYINNIWLLPYLQDKVQYDPARDFAPISLISS